MQMTQENYKSKHEEIYKRFRSSYEKVINDKKTIQEIQDRNILESFFSNNTRDLARAGISQNELILELFASFQDILGLIQSGAKVSTEIMQTLEELQAHSSKTNDDFQKKFMQLLQKASEQDKATNKVQEKVDNQQLRIVSQEQVGKIIRDIRELATKQGHPSIKIFIEICTGIRKYFSSSSLSSSDKRTIVLTVKERQFGILSSDELITHRDKFIHIFKGAIPAKKSGPGIWGHFISGTSIFKDTMEFNMADAVSGVLDAAVVSESDRYVEFRDNLILLLDEFLDKKIDVNDEHAPELVAIRKRLLESQFEIALVGEFQGGKSTTFNMLCGGREISPRGLNGGGIKTSAAVVTAQNIEANETKNGLSEWAEITWLTSDEIKRRIGEALKIYDCDQEHKKLAEKVEETTATQFEELLKIAWDSNPKNDPLDSLRVATLQHRLLSSSNFSKYSGQTVVPIDEFQHIVKFPNGWESHWGKKYKADFTPEECLFSCVDRVLVRIHSTALERLGCRITDCPGLFVSRWDTERAISVMKSANAIWYLLSGDKQIGSADEQALQHIKDYEWADKCFFSINRRKSRNATDELLKVDTSILKNNGFHPEQVFLYNAFLAFRKTQLLLVKNGLSAKDLECLALETKSNSFVDKVLQELTIDERKREQAIKKLIVNHLYALDEEDLAETLRDENTISTELILQLKVESGINEILPAIEKMIITQRARSILIDHGVEPCLKVLEHFSTDLKQKESDAVKTLEEAEKRAEEAKSKLDQFIKTWKENFSFLKITAFDHELAIDFFNEYDIEIKHTISERAVEICKEEWHGSHYDSDAVNNATERRIQDAFLNLIRAKLEVYLKNIRENPKFKENIGDKTLTKLSEMKDEWKELKSGVDLFDSIETATEAGIHDFSFESFDQKIAGSIDVPWYSWEFFKDIFTLWIRRLFQSTDDRIDEFFREKDPIGAAYNEFKGDSNNEQQIADFLGETRRNYAKCLEESFEEMKNRLDTSIKATQDFVKKSNEEKEKIAKMALEMRKDIDDFYSEKIQKFKDEVCRFYVE